MDSLLSQTQVKRWSFVYFIAIVLSLAGCHVTLDKAPHVTGVMLALATLAFVYCRYVGELPIAGVEELVFAAATGPVAMYATSYFVVGTVPWPVIFYALPVALFTFAFLVRLPLSLGCAKTRARTDAYRPIALSIPTDRQERQGRAVCAPHGQDARVARAAPRL